MVLKDSERSMCSCFQALLCSIRASSLMGNCRRRYRDDDDADEAADDDDAAMPPNPSPLSDRGSTRFQQAQAGSIRRGPWILAARRPLASRPVRWCSAARAFCGFEGRSFATTSTVGSTVRSPDGLRREKSRSGSRRSRSTRSSSEGVEGVYSSVQFRCVDEAVRLMRIRPPGGVNEKIHGQVLEESWKSHGNIMEKSWESDGTCGF